MRKYYKLCFFIILTTCAYSQYKIGFQFSPFFSFNRIKTDLPVETSGVGMRLGLGPTIDYELSDKYSLNSGLLFMPKRVAYTVTTKTDSANFSGKHSIWYLQIPINFKAYTNEISLDKKLYIQFGTNFEFKTNDEQTSGEEEFIQKFRFMDVSLAMCIGLEYKIGTSTSVYAGLMYSRGLINVLSKYNKLSSGEISLNNDLVGLQIGIHP